MMQAWFGPRTVHATLAGMGLAGVLVLGACQVFTQRWAPVRDVASIVSVNSQQWLAQASNRSSKTAPEQINEDLNNIAALARGGDNLSKVAQVIDEPVIEDALKADVLASSPSLTVDLVWLSTPHRQAIVEGELFGEGDVLPGKLRITRITEAGVTTVDRHGRRTTHALNTSAGESP